MKRVVAVVVVLAVAAFIAWRVLGRDNAASTTAKAGSSSTDSVATNGANVGVTPREKVDPRTQPVGSLAGTVKDEAGRPIAGTTVCLTLSSDELPPDFLDEGVCMPADPTGAFKFEKLFAAEYRVNAGAPTYVPALFHPGGDREKEYVKLEPGEAKTGIDIVLHGGGFELKGIVSDIGGGPIAKARVHAAAGLWQGVDTPITETDATGAYTLWVPKGSVRVTANAEGYAQATEYGSAPGKVDVLLTPESSLAGVVLNAKTNQPVEGADVVVDRTDAWGAQSQRARTDAKGAFKVAKLVPGRYNASVRDETGIGQSPGSVLVGLGQNVDGVVVKVYPAARVIGKVMIAGTKDVCEDGSFSLHSVERAGWLGGTADDDGTITVEGVLPGTYTLTGECPGYIDGDDKKTVDVGDKDVTGVIVEVRAGGKIIGKVTRKDGTPVADAGVRASAMAVPKGGKEGWGYSTTLSDGSYEMRGLRAYTYKIDATSSQGVAPAKPAEVAVKPGDVITHDIVLDDGGSIVGTVEDQDGHPVAGAKVRSWPLEQRTMMYSDNNPTTDAAGAFEITSLRPGKYSVYASPGNGWDAMKKPGTTDDDKQSETVTVELAKAAKVKLVVEKPNGTISGTVVDAQGNPVNDAFISSARESDAKGSNGSSVSGTRNDWWGDSKPSLTSTEGAFTLKDLAPGNYTLRAYRKGGGEGVLEHVAVGSKTAKIPIRETGSFAGMIVGGALPDTLTVHVEDGKIGFERDEQFFRSTQFEVHDLPPGHYKVTASSETGHGQIELDLAGNENKTGVAIQMEELITLTGHVQDLKTKAGVPDITVSAAPLGAGFGFSFGDDDETENITDATGAFTVKRVAKSKLLVTALPRDFRDSKYTWSSTIRDVTNAKTAVVDIGTIHTLEKRVQEGGMAGDIGLHFKDLPPGSSMWEVSLEVSWIDPKGPAAGSGIKIGDTITSIDGYDMTGDDRPLATSLMNAPVGTTLSLGLQRGATVSITLAPR